MALGTLCSLALAACGGGSGTPPATSTTASTSPTASTPTSIPGASGTLAAISGSTLEIQNPTSGQVSVILTKSTAIGQTVKASAAQVVVGACVAATGTRATSGTITAGVVEITHAGATGCTRAGAGAPGRAGGFPGRTGGTFRTKTTGSTRTGAPSKFGSAFGKVTATSKSSFTVQGTSRASVTASTTVVTTTVDETASTTYLQMITGTVRALKVGDCVTAIGPTNSIGAVTARTLDVLPAGPGGCTTGLGRAALRGLGGIGGGSTTVTTPSGA